MFSNAMANTNGEAAKNFMENAETPSMYINAKEAMELLTSSGPHGAKTARQFQSMLTKAVGIGDIGAVRLVSLDTSTTKLYDPTTVFLNMLEPSRRNTVTDFTHGFTEESYGPAALDSMVFNPNNAPNEDNGPRERRTNTLTAIGTQVNVGIVSGEMIKKRGFMDELDRQLTDAMVKVRKSENRQLLLSTEDAAGPVFKVGGFSTRITTNVTSLSGADPDREDLETLIAEIVAATGVRRLRILAHPRALGVIHGWLKSDFPNFAISDFAKVNNMAVFMSTVFFSHLVGPVECYLESQLPEGELIIFDPDMVSMNGFTIGDQAGPWVVSLAQTGLTYEPKVIFDLITLEDRHEKTRGKLTNVKMA